MKNGDSSCGEVQLRLRRNDHESKVLHKGVEFLDLKDKGMDVEDAALLAGWIEHEHAVLTSIDLSGNEYLIGRKDSSGYEGWNRTPWLAFCRGLAMCEKLHTLNCKSMPQKVQRHNLLVLFLLY